MAHQVAIKLVLVGPRQGMNIVLQGREFVKGVHVLQGNPDILAGAVDYFGRCYNAHPEGSVAHKDALAQWEVAKKEASDGQRDLQSSPEPDAPEEVSGEVQPDGGGSAEVAADDSGPDDDSATGTAGSVPGGDGHADTRVPPQISPEQSGRIQEALSILDHSNDDHWTQDGKPAVSAVSEALGENVSRQVLDLVAPDFTRPVQTDQQES